MVADAHSDNPKLDALLQQALALHPKYIDLTLDRLRALLEKLGHPERHLPPVFHVAGTNGKGSTCAYLRACLEASGRRVHVYSSPHLVRFNERIRLAGRLISDDLLIAVMEEVIAINGGAAITFFELTTAVAFLAFARTEADALVLEVGMGGRMDATNVVEKPIVTAIAQLGLDHQQFLGETLVEIAAEKAGIAKADVPLVLARAPRAASAVVMQIAQEKAAPVKLRGTHWDIAHYEGQLHYRDQIGKLSLPLPRLAGAHQIDNAGLAIAMLRHQQALPIAEGALRAGMGWVEWPARLQRLETGALSALLPQGAELWLDGGHNPAAARVIVDAFRAQDVQARPFYLVFGMLETKDVAGFLKPFAGRVTAAYGVPITGHASHGPEVLNQAARAAGFPLEMAENVAAALTHIARQADRLRPPVVLIAGSLYLAGQVLRENGTPPL